MKIIAIVCAVVAAGALVGVKYYALQAEPTSQDVTGATSRQDCLNRVSKANDEREDQVFKWKEREKQKCIAVGPDQYEACAFKVVETALASMKAAVMAHISGDAYCKAKFAG